MSDYERSRAFACVGRIVWSRICRIYWDFQDGGGPADAGGLVRALDESLRAFTRDHEHLRVFACVGWIVWSRICRIYWDFQDGGGPAGTGALYERWMRREERLRVLGGLSGAGFAGFIGIFRMGEDLLTQVGSYERWTRDCERLRVLGGLGGARDHERLRVFACVGRIV